MKLFNSKMLNVLYLGLLSYNLSYAGVVLTGTEEEKDFFTGKKKAKTITTYLDKGRIRMEEIADGKKNIVIFRKDKGVFISIDEKRKTYSELTKKDLEKMKAEMAKAMAESAAAFQGISAEEQKALAGLMGQEASKAFKKEVKKAKKEQKKNKPEKPEYVYKKKGSGSKVGSWSCEEYVGFKDQRKFEEICTVNWKKLNLNPEDFKSFEDMAQFFTAFFTGEQDEAISGKELHYDLKAFEKELGYPGFPVKSISFGSDGKVTGVSELKDIQRQNFSAALFEVPSGYKREANDFKFDSSGRGTASDNEYGDY